METAQPHNCTEVKKTNFHHRVKNFYYKNLFRKIYTVAIIGLIGANVFSLLKYQTFADELESDIYSSHGETNSTDNELGLSIPSEDDTLTVADVDHTKDIVIEFTVTEPGQSIRINKYFDNDYTVDWESDGNPQLLSSNTSHSYSTIGTHRVTLSLANGADRWTFKQYDSRTPLVNNNNGVTTVTDVKIKSMPSLAEGFGESETNPGDYFFAYFNYNSVLTELPENSFNTSNIESVGNDFFSSFNSRGALTELPANSFRIENITTVGDSFFSSFNSRGALTELPANSFRTENITTVGHNFFSSFNDSGALIELPENSFKLSSDLVSVGDWFFYAFNGAFDRYNSNGGALTKLPEGSFRTENIITAGDCFFGYFNNRGALTELPANSFNISNIETVGYGFFGSFNEKGSISRLPEGSFDMSKIVSVGGASVNTDYNSYGFFQRFNYNGAITYLPDSFTINSIGLSSYHGYEYAFNSQSYTLQNKKVSDLVAGIDVPTEDKDMFSDNQPGRCGVYSTRLESLENACSDEDCGEGYHGVNNKCVSDDGGIYYGDGYIEIRNGDKVVYLKDKNQGASKSADEIMDKKQEIEELQKDMCEMVEVVDNPIVLEDLHVMGGIISARQCSDEFYKEAGRIIGLTNATKEDVDDFISSDYGTYYYRGNNTGARYTELWDDYGNVNISEEVYNRGFNGGVMGEDPNNGWIEGNIQDNPCNGEGEYLPTYEDRKVAMEIWSDIHGYDLYTHNYSLGGSFYPTYNGYSYYNGIYLINNFWNDVLLTSAGYLHQYFEPIYIEPIKSLSYNNQDTKKDRLIDALAMLFTNSVYGYDVGGLQMVFNNGSYLHMALDSGYNYGTIDGGNLEYYNLGNNSYDNTIAAPVRCFIDPAYFQSGKWYTVTFMDGDEELFTKQVKEGKTIKNVKEPTKDNYAFVGWYTDSKLKNEFDMGTQITRDIKLYAKWAPKGVFHKDGYIKVTDGKNTIYVSDKNVGVSDAAVNLLRFNQLWDKRDYECQNSSDNACRSRKYMNGTGEINELLGTQYSDILEAETDIYSKVLEGLLTPEEMDYFTKYRVVDRNYIGAQCDLEGGPDNCYDDKWLDYINGIMGNETEDFEEFDNTDDARDAIYDKYGDDVVDKDYWPMLGNQPNGNYYYRGNNSGVSYNDLEFDPSNGSITNMDDLISKGFDGGKIGMEGEGWIEGNPNPCDASKGEYLPTPEDWKNLMKIWGNANDYELEGEEEGTYNYEGIDYTEYEYRFDPDLGVKMQSDLLLPAGGSIYETTCGNDEPCMELDDSFGLRASQDNEGKMGAFYRGGVSYTHYNVRLDNVYRPDNTQAVPVRCFLNIEEPEDEEEEVTPTPTPTPSYSGGGGGGRRINKDNKKDEHNTAEEESKNQNETTVSEESSENLQGHGSAPQIEIELDIQKYNATYTPEQNTAYQFAYAHGITTKPTIQEAKMSTPLTRIQMAKMLSYYAINVLGQTPDYSRGMIQFNDVSNKLNKEYNNGVTLAYQLGIMGINMKSNNFRPNDIVTRAEFATALSRMLYGLEDGTGKIKYYEPHIAKLYNEGIINKADPKLIEKRGYVMLMLMRTVE